MGHPRTDAVTTNLDEALLGGPASGRDQPTAKGPGLIIRALPVDRRPQLGSILDADPRRVMPKRRCLTSRSRRHRPESRAEPPYRDMDTRPSGWLLHNRGDVR